MDPDPKYRATQIKGYNFIRSGTDFFFCVDDSVLLKGLILIQSVFPDLNSGCLWHILV